MLQPVQRAAGTPRPPLPVARLTTPSAPSPTASAQPLPIARTATPAGAGHVVQRGFRSATRSATETLAASAAATVANTLGRLRSSRQEPETVEDDPLPFPPDRNTAAATSAATASAPPAYTRVPKGTFDPKDLTDFQLDELVHLMIGRITRLVRTELRMDRERIGRLRDDRR
ncbi:extensin [Streptomyces sp. NPDC051214]|uniref:extensin n=1 Tax=Streptomyces sp. NPDC051214 TaxID=3155282 RepID=UPI0034379C41